MGEILLSHIDVLVHPGYHSIYSRPPQADEVHILLTGKWDQRVQQIARKEPTGILLYHSALTPFDLDAAIDCLANLGHSLKNEDIQRILKYKGILQERFFYS